MIWQKVSEYAMCCETHCCCRIKIKDDWQYELWDIHSNKCIWHGPSFKEAAEWLKEHIESI